jgi:hypothetical protein
MKILDNWAGNIILFVIGYLSVREQATFMILFQLMIVLYRFGAGLDQASNALIGKFIG